MSTDGQQPTWLPPVVTTDRPLRAPDAALAARQQARVRRGYSEDGPDHPRGGWWAAGVLPIGLLDVAAVVTLLITGSAVAGVAVAVLSAALVVLVLLIAADPLRLTTAQRRSLTAARVWRSSHDWVPPFNETTERVQLARAQQAVGRIAGSAWWWQDSVADLRWGVDLITELDDVDAQAFRLAVAALGVPTGTRVPADPSVMQLRAALETRVQSLEALAAELDRQDHHHTALPGAARAVGPVPTLDAIVGGVIDEEAAVRIRALTRAIRESGPR